MVYLETTNDWAFTVTNTGNGTLRLTGLTIDNPDVESVTPAWLFPLTLSPGRHLNITVRFSPTSVGDFEGEVVVHSNDPLTPDKSIALTATVPPAGKRIGLLVANVSSLDPEELAAGNLLRASNFAFTPIDPSTIATNPSVLTTVDGFWADNAGPVAAFADSVVYAPLLDAVSGGRGILLSFGGGYVGQCMGLGNATSGYWCPWYSDAGYFMRAPVPHPVYDGIAEWDGVLPKRPEQLIYAVNPGCKTGRGITFTGSGVTVHQLTQLVDAAASTYVATNPHVSEKQVGNGVAVHIPENGFTLGTWGPAGKQMIVNALNYVCSYGGQPQEEPVVVISESDLYHDFGGGEPGEQVSWVLTVQNAGGAALHITDVSSDVAAFFAGVGSIDIPAQGSVSIPIFFKPTRVGEYSGHLTIQCNDPHNAPVTVVVVGRGVASEDCVYGTVAFWNDPDESVPQPLPYATVELRIYSDATIDTYFETSANCDAEGNFYVGLQDRMPDAEVWQKQHVFLLAFKPVSDVDSSRLIDVIRHRLDQTKLDIALVAHDFPAIPDYQSSGRHFRIHYDPQERSVRLESWVTELVIDIGPDQVPRRGKAPVFIRKLADYFEYALQSFAELNLGNMPELEDYTVRVESSYQIPMHDFVYGGTDEIHIPTEGYWGTSVPVAVHLKAQNLSVHELFHKLESTYNEFYYGTRRQEWQWLLEGLAGWAADAIHYRVFMSQHPDFQPSAANNTVMGHPESYNPFGNTEQDYYYAAPAFWSFFAGQLGSPGSIINTEEVETPVYGAQVIDYLLRQWASLKDDVIAETLIHYRSSWPSWHGGSFFLPFWFIANIAKDFPNKQVSADWPLYQYSRYVACNDCNSPLGMKVYDPISFPDGTDFALTEVVQRSPLPIDMKAYACGYSKVTPLPGYDYVSIYPLYMDPGKGEVLLPQSVPIAVPLSSENELGTPMWPAGGCFDISQLTDECRLLVLLPNYDRGRSGCHLVLASSVEACEPLEFGKGSPVEMVIIDPAGNTNTSAMRQSENVLYGEEPDPDNPADTNSRFVFLTPFAGVYRVLVQPRPAALPTDTYSLFCFSGDDTTWIARDIQVADIPLNGYFYHTSPFARVEGTVVTGTAQALSGVPIDIYDAQGNLWQSAVTDDSGYYYVDSIPNGDYTIAVVTPLGYQPDQETKEFTINHMSVTVDFTLTPLDITPSPRTRAWWANQLQKALQGRPQQYNVAQFAALAGAINQHFNQNLLNPVDFYSVPQPATRTDSLNAMKRLLNMLPGSGDGPFIQRLGKAELMALMLNVAAGKIHQMEAISRDSISVSQAITYCEMLVNDEIDPPDDGGPGCGEEFFRYLRADFILTLVNLGLKVPAGMIPADVIQIAYRLRDEQAQPDQFALFQNCPNPFNPTTEISFSLPQAGQAALEIYNIMGQKVATLVDERLEAGQHTYQWDASGNASGVYFYRLTAEGVADTKKMLLIK